tara:strand:+ start:2735 stop:3415 length:681 start_codon:yes stop_codon:yes gene_type:complete
MMADNEIYIDQTGNNVAIDIEQLGSSNLIGGLNSTEGSVTAAIFNGGSWTFDINQIGSSNSFLTDGIYGESFTGFFEFDGDSNQFEISMDTTGLNGADYVNANVDITGSSNVFDIDWGETSAVDYLDLDWIIDGDSNEFEIDIDSEYYTNYVDIFGDSNTLTLVKSGYGASSTDGGYFYMDLTGDSNTVDITQSSTLARDWIKIESDASNSNICIIQNDGGTSTSC